MDSALIFEICKTIVATYGVFNLTYNGIKRLIDFYRGRYVKKYNDTQKRLTEGGCRSLLSSFLVKYYSELGYGDYLLKIIHNGKYESIPILMKPEWEDAVKNLEKPDDLLVKPLDKRELFIIRGYTRERNNRQL